ncbi:MAG: MbnP family protein [Crocinitomicaceae bacterium]
MKNLKIAGMALIAVTVLATSCRKKGCTDETAYNYNDEAKKDDGTCTYENTATLKFTQSWDGNNVTSSDFDEIKFKNANDENMSIVRLRYSISDVRFYKADGDSVMIDMHHLIDVSDATTLTKVLDQKIDPIDYTGIGFIFGLTPDKNVSGSILEFNAATWNWPEMIGGGYHQMQFDGKFINADTDTIGYNFHNGSVTKDAGSSDAAVPNYIFVKLDQTIAMNSDKTIEIDMQIGEWFKNPNLWDLNTLYTMLMPNKAAQLLISENGKSVFKLGAIN